LTRQDDLTKYSIAIPLENQEVNTVAEAFVIKVCLIHGIPQIILTDHGTNFMSQVFKQSCKLFKIQKVTSSAYHPESNGSLERSYKVLVEYLRCICAEKQSEWEKWIPFAIFVYNTTPHTATKFTPFELVYGRLANLPGALQKAPRSPLYNYEYFLLNTKYKMQVMLTLM
jgi:transposase InsO family protein